MGLVPLGPTRSPEETRPRSSPMPGSARIWLQMFTEGR